MKKIILLAVAAFLSMTFMANAQDGGHAKKHHAKHHHSKSKHHHKKEHKSEKDSK